MRKSKKLFAVLLSAMMVLCMMPAMAFAQSESASASIGGQTYDSLKAAVEAAKDGDTIELKNGTYDGNLTIDKKVKIVGESKEGTVIVRTETTGDILLAKKNIGLENLTVDGKDESGAHILGHGVHAEKGLTMRNVDVVNVVCRAESPLCGVQTGVAVYVDNLTDAPNTEAVLIQDVNIKDFQKGGVVCKTTGSVLIERVNIVGADKNDKIAQNGIQINNTQYAVIKDTSVSDVVCDREDAASSGLLLVSGAHAVVDKVTFENVDSDFGFYEYDDATESKVFVKEGNTVTMITDENRDGEVLHKYSKTEANAPTCTDDGNIEYWYCEICDEYYSDEDCTQTIALEETVLKALGHDFKDGVCTVCGAEDPNYNPGENGEPTTPPTDNPPAGGTTDDSKDKDVSKDKTQADKADKEDKDAPKTGDATSAMPFVLLVTSLAAAGSLIALRKREE